MFEPPLMGGFFLFFQTLRKRAAFIRKVDPLKKFMFRTFSIFQRKAPPPTDAGTGIKSDFAIANH